MWNFLDDIIDLTSIIIKAIGRWIYVYGFFSFKLLYCLLYYKYDHLDLNKKEN